MRRHLLLPLLLLAALAHAAPPSDPDPAQPPSLRGAWRAYVTRSDVIVARTDTRYVFGNVGWALPDSLPEGLDPQHSALVATLELSPDGTVQAFILPDPIQNDRAIRCEREPAPPELSPRALAGDYAIVQRRPGAADTREAPYTLTLTDRNTYLLTGKLPHNAPYATGTYAIRGASLTLTPAAPSQGLWDNPSFFPHDGALILNDPAHSVRLLPKDNQPLLATEPAQ